MFDEWQQETMENKLFDLFTEWMKEEIRIKLGSEAINTPYVRERIRFIQHPSLEFPPDTPFEVFKWDAAERPLMLDTLWYGDNRFDIRYVTVQFVGKTGITVTITVQYAYDYVRKKLLLRWLDQAYRETHYSMLGYHDHIETEQRQ